MAGTTSFLKTTLNDIRCQNPMCQAVAPHDKRITIENLLFTGWTCPQRDCGWVHEGALADPAKIPAMPEYKAPEEPEPLTAEKVEAAKLEMEEAAAARLKASVLALITESEHLITHEEIAVQLQIELKVVDTIVVELIAEGAVVVGDPTASKEEA